QVDFVEEITERTREKHGIQQPAENDASPGMQPRHGLPQPLFFAIGSHVCTPAIHASSVKRTAGIRMPVHVRHVLVHENAHSAATACITKASMVDVRTASERDMPANGRIRLIQVENAAANP